MRNDWVTDTQDWRYLEMSRCARWVSGRKCFHWVESDCRLCLHRGYWGSSTKLWHPHHCFPSSAPLPRCPATCTHATSLLWAVRAGPSSLSAESLCKSDKALTSPRTLCCLIPSANPFLTDVCLQQWEGEGCCLLGDALLKVVAGQHQGLPAGAA